MKMDVPRLSHEASDREALRALSGAPKDRNAAMRVLFDRHTVRLMRHLRFRFSLPESIAEEITAQVFLRAYEKADDFRGDCEVASWLVQIARNLAVDHLRREGRMESLEDEDFAGNADIFCELVPASHEPHALLENKQVAHCVRERFTTFRLRHPEAATALWERHVNEVSPQEIAPMLGRTYRATCQFLSEWGKKLRQFVAPCYELLKGE